MSKINAVRFINLNYNHNMIRVSDETMYFNGDSTLIKLDNGGGKSVLVQMMTAPFVQKRYRNTKDRPFASYFTSGKPTFILVEWELEQQAGSVMTGMMVRQNQKTEDGNEDELEIINFISEYREPCLQDLNHLPVVEKSKDEIRLKSFAECRVLFDSYKRDRSVRFFSYDMNNAAQSRQYFDKLLEYGINYREWQNIIKKVNEEESGLSKLFADCKDERGLIEKWFLDTIENKLNRDQNRMQEFRNILEKYIASYRSNQSKIKRRDIILLFEKEASKIREQAQEYLNCSVRRDDKRKEIGSYLMILHEMQEAVSSELEAEKAYIEELKQELLKIDHQKHSADYYAAQDQIAHLREEIDELSTSLTKMDEQRLSWERTLHLLEVADRQEQVNTAQEDYQQAVQALEICRRKGEDLKPERDYIGFLLRLHFEEILSHILSMLTESRDTLKEKAAAKTETANAAAKTEEDIRRLAQKIGELRASVQSYDREEDRYISHWGERLSRNILGEYEPGYLAIMLENLVKEMTEATQERSAKRKKLEGTDSSIRKLENTLTRQDKTRQELSSKIRAAQERLSLYEEELQFRRTVLQYLELKEDAVFDVVRILRTADSKIAELELIVERAGIEAQALEDEVFGLTTGQTVELTPELQHVFESLDIPIVYGMEWLKRNGKSEEENLSMVEQNPFLPYALLMTEKEFERLKTADVPIYTSAPIPVVTRECLVSDGASPTSGMFENTRVHFYMMFNRNLLNAERLEVLLAQKRRDLSQKKEEIERKRKEHREHLERRTKIEGQEVTKAGYEELRKSITDLQERLDTIRQEYTSTKEQLAAAKDSKRQLEEDLAALVRRIDEKARQRNELEELTQAYERYLLHLREKAASEKKLATLDAQKKKLQATLQMLEEDLRSLEAKLRELQQQESDAKNQAGAFELYQETACPPGFSPELSTDYPAMIAWYHAITDNVSREEIELEAARKKAFERLSKAEKELERRVQKHGFNPEDWANVQYSAAEQDHAESEISSLDHSIRDTSGRKHSLDIQRGKKEESLRQILEWMQRDCGNQIPMQREDVPVLDYAGQKNILLHQKSEHEKTAVQQSGRLQIFGANITALSEYQDDSVEAPVRLKGDFAHFTEQDFRSFTGNLQKEYRAAVTKAQERQHLLEKTLQQTLRIDDFRDDYYRRPLETILSLSSDAVQVLKQLDVILQSYRDLMAKLMVDIAVVEQERAHVIAALKEYASDIHSQMGKIDRNSSVLVRGKPLKMLKITLPPWEENDNIYQRRIEDLVDELTQKGIALIEKGDSVHDFVGKRLTTRELYDAVVGIGNVRIQLYKIEAQRELQISWSEVARNSGGEGFLSAFIILSSLLYYMRRDETDIFADRNEGKVLLMDNPFAQTNASHLLKPMMEVAKKNNTQLICLTGLGGESIYNRFDNIYVLNLVESAMNSAQYLRGKHVSGNDPEVISVARIEVNNDSGQMEFLF